MKEIAPIWCFKMKDERPFQHERSTRKKLQHNIMNMLMIAQTIVSWKS